MRILETGDNKISIMELFYSGTHLIFWFMSQDVDFWVGNIAIYVRQCMFFKKMCIYMRDLLKKFEYFWVFVTCEYL